MNSVHFTVASELSPVTATPPDGIHSCLRMRWPSVCISRRVVVCSTSSSDHGKHWSTSQMSAGMRNFIAVITPTMRTTPGSFHNSLVGFLTFDLYNSRLGLWGPRYRVWAHQDTGRILVTKSRRHTSQSDAHRQRNETKPLFNGSPCVAIFMDFQK